jgi:hypothetical protein
MQPPKPNKTLPLDPHACSLRAQRAEPVEDYDTKRQENMYPQRIFVTGDF